MTFPKTLPVLAVALLALTACGTKEDTKAETTPSPTETSVAVVSSSSATPSESAATSASASASSSATSTAAASPSQSASESSAAAEGDTVEVTLTVQVDGTAEFSHLINGNYEDEVISEGFTRTFSVPADGTTAFSVDASNKKTTANEVICELRYNGKVIASYSSAERDDLVRATCGITGDINTMPEQPSKLK